MMTSKRDCITFETVCKLCNLPAPAPTTIDDLIHLENVFDVMDMYLWLSYRFPQLFSDVDNVRSAQDIIDKQILETISNISKLLTDEQLRELSAQTTGKCRTDFRL